MMAEAQDHTQVRSPLEIAFRGGHGATQAADIKQEDGLPSLRQFLSKHLQQREHPELAAPAAVSKESEITDAHLNQEHFSMLLTPFEVFARGEQPQGQAGHQLNQLDTEMAAGLEHMLPTPSFRFKVMRNRIANELMILEAQLTQYQEIVDPPAGLLAKITSLQKRRALLTQHDTEISFRQAAITVRPPVWIRVLKISQNIALKASKGLGSIFSRTLSACSPLAVARRANPMQMQLVQLNHQLGNLADVLDKELSQRGPGAMNDLGDVSSMLRQYEQLVRRGNRLGQVIGNRPGLMDRANGWLQLNIRHWLTYWQG